MTSRDDLRQALTDAGRAPVEPVGERMAGLEQRLLRSIADDDVDGATVLLPSGSTDTRGAGWSRGRLMLAAAAAVTAILLTASLLVGRSTDEQLVIASADAVEVMLPDGSFVDGVAGLELPDGTTVDVGGSLVVDGRRYRAGLYRVDDGEIVPVPSPSSSSVVASTERVEQPGTSVRVDDPAPSDSAPTRTTTLTTTTAPTTTPTRPDEPTPTTDPVRTTSPPVDSTTEPVRTTSSPVATTAPPARPTLPDPSTTQRPTQTTTTTEIRRPDPAPRSPDR